MSPAKAEANMKAGNDLRLARAILLPALLAAAVSGCIVAVSINPWLDVEKATLTPSIAGVWVDTNQFPKTATAYFVIHSERKGYDLTLTNSNDSEAWRYECDLHSVGDTLLLQVGPIDGGIQSPGAILPAYMLFKVDLTNTTMKIYPLDKDSFEKRAKKSRLVLAETEAKEKGRNEPVIVGSLTENLEKFIGKNLKDKTFFSSEPLYSFMRVGSNAAAAAESKNHE
jgi:hypothetical protein